MILAMLGSSGAPGLPRDECWRACVSWLAISEYQTHFEGSLVSYTGLPRVCMIQVELIMRNHSTFDTWQASTPLAKHSYHSYGAFDSYSCSPWTSSIVFPATQQACGASLMVASIILVSYISHLRAWPRKRQSSPALVGK